MAGSNINGNQTVHFSIAGGAATADFDGQGWIADGSYELMEVVERHAVASSVATAEIHVVKVPSGTAKGSGTEMLEAPLETNGTADTNQTGTLSATLANRRVTKGQMIALFLDEAATSLDGVTITLKLKALTEGSWS